MTLNVLRKRIITSVILILLILLMYSSIFFMISGLLIFGVLSILEFFNLTKRIFKKKIYYLISNFLYIFFISFFSTAFFILYNFTQTKIILFILLFGCVASDIGGYLFGKLLKGPRLTKISPKKTISGALGSFILTCLVITSLIYYETNNLNYSIIITGLMTSLFCQFGDLFFFLLKKKS